MHQRGSYTQNIQVVGAGVAGLTTAIALLEEGYSVTIHDPNDPAGNCSLNSGAIWGPFLSGQFSRISSWSTITHRELLNLAQAASSGVSVVTGIGIDHGADHGDWWVAEHEGAEEVPTEHGRAWRFQVPIVDMPVYLDFLRRRAEALGGNFIQVRVKDLQSLVEGGDHVVLCAGLKSAVLADDPDVVPIRGELVVIENPGLTEFVSLRGDGPELTYILPQGSKAILGGTAEWNVGGTAPHPQAADEIIRRCAAFEPSVASAPVIGHRVGVRPYRATVRVEHAADAHIIYNYGHGGSGVSISWGCARDVVDLLEDCIATVD